MQKLKNARSLIVRQKRKWGEILTGFEYKNKYSISDENGEEFLAVREAGGNILLRWFLKASRPFTIELVDINSGALELSIRRPFRFFFQECEVKDSRGMILGTIKWRWAFFKKLFDVIDSNGNVIMNIEGPFFKPWTFNVFKGEMDAAQIVKKWSGLGKELFTNEDNFGVSFNINLNESEKAILLCAVIFFDFLYFEER